MLDMLTFQFTLPSKPGQPQLEYIFGNAKLQNHLAITKYFR